MNALPRDLENLTSEHDQTSQLMVPSASIGKFVIHFHYHSGMNTFQFAKMRMIERVMNTSWMT